MRGSLRVVRYVPISTYPSFLFQFSCLSPSGAYNLGYEQLLLFNEPV